MQIKQSNTYKYETKHFGKMLEHDVVAGECFNNVKTFCSTYASLGRNVSVSVVIGMRSWDDGGATYGYHYLVKDEDTGEYSDPQYARYTFVELHSWSLKDYIRECEVFEDKYGGPPAEEFAFHYAVIYKKQLLAALKFIKSQGWCRVSDAKLKEYLQIDADVLTVQPKYGRKAIECFNIS